MTLFTVHRTAKLRLNSLLARFAHRCNLYPDRFKSQIQEGHSEEDLTPKKLIPVDSNVSLVDHDEQERDVRYNQERLQDGYHVPKEERTVCERVNDDVNAEEYQNAKLDNEQDGRCTRMLCGLRFGDVKSVPQLEGVVILVQLRVPNVVQEKH